MSREPGQKRKASRACDKNAGSVFEQRNALARHWAHLRDEVRHRAGRACHGLDFASFRSDPVHCDGSVKKQNSSDPVPTLKSAYTPINY
ncbi:hypothetical protein AL522_22930 [Pantoea vagans]|nr:hypothetical protein AL522_22930 [Pantoea vagans]